MRTTVRLLCWLLLGSAALSGGGCGSDKKSGKAADPLATVTGFCEAWGVRACNQLVADACLAKSTTECASQQALFCLSKMPPNYARKNADACLAKVAEAYADAKLTAQEKAVVMDFAAPCDKLIEGPGAAGDPCRETSQCNTLEDLVCVMRPGDASGTCQVPVIQGGGRACGDPAQTCESDFYCNGTNCVERPVDGQPCSDGVPCAETALCTGAPGEQICAAKKADREACASDAECLSKICAFSGMTGRCAPQIVLDAADPLCTNLAQ